jgi:hypothetical protein
MRPAFRHSGLALPDHHDGSDRRYRRDNYIEGKTRSRPSTPDTGCKDIHIGMARPCRATNNRMAPDPSRAGSRRRSPLALGDSHIPPVLGARLLMLPFAQMADLGLIGPSPFFF